ncbi:MAG: glycosyl hydrolase family 28-related protein, partial [Alphaproteobacteria bacterium]
MADTPRTHSELLKLLADNTEGAITPQVLRDLLVSLDLYPLNVKRFGAKGDGLTDDTKAIEKAIAESQTYLPERFLPVYFPPGDYMCHELEWNGQTPLVGFEVGNSRLMYNGDGGPKSAVIRYEEDEGATPWAGFSNLTISGMDTYSSSAKIAEHCYLRVGKTGTDWGAKFENLHFRNCFGNAVDFGSGTIVNIHMNRIRFDAIGGFCLRFSADASHESRPVSIYQFTYDNSPSPEFFGFAAQMQGHYDKRHWGKGFLLLEDTNGVTFNVSDGRIELNAPLQLHDTRKAIIYVNQTIEGGNTAVRLENVHGFLQPEDGGVGVFAKEGRTSFTATASKIRNATALFEDYKQKRVISRAAQEVAYQANPQQSQGVYLQASQLEVRAGPPDGTVYNLYRQGDIVFREKVRSGTHLGWVCTDTDGHLRIPAAPLYKGAVAVTAGSPVVSVLAAERRRDFVSGLAIT